MRLPDGMLYAIIYALIHRSAWKGYSLKLVGAASSRALVRSLSATQDSACNQKRVCRARRRQHRYGDKHPEASVASALLLAAHLAVVGGAGHSRLGLDQRPSFLRYPPRVGQRRRHLHFARRGRVTGRGARHEAAGGQRLKPLAHGVGADNHLLASVGERSGQPVGALWTLAQQVEDL